jgi:transcriptional regulator with XRE-family HTH domain
MLVDNFRLQPEQGPDVACRVEELSELVRRLRTQRGLTQQELAQKAEYSVELVRRVEQGRDKFSIAKARDTLEILGLLRPLTETEAHDFLVQCDVTISIGGRLPNDEYIRLVEKKQVFGPTNWSRPTTAAYADVASQHLHALLDLLIAVIGVDKATEAVRSMMAIANVPAPASPATGPALNLIAPPVQRHTPDGKPYIEQIIRTVTPAPSPATIADVSSAKPHRRKRSI